MVHMVVSTRRRQSAAGDTSRGAGWRTEAERLGTAQRHGPGMPLDVVETELGDFANAQTQIQRAARHRIPGPVGWHLPRE